MTRRARWIGLVGVVAAAVAIAAPVTIAQTRSAPTEPRAPEPQAARSADQFAAGNGDAAAAERILRAGGWNPKPGSLEVATSRPASGEVGAYTLWNYEGDAGLAQLLLGATDPLGGVNTECSAGPVLLRACGNAVSSEGYALVVGSAGPEVSKVEIQEADGSVVEAAIGKGSWFARLPASTGTPRPSKIVAYTSDGSQATSIDPALLRDSIKYRPPGAASGR